MKKRSITRMLLSLCVALAMCIALAVPGFAATTKAANGLFAGGSGTKTDPYEIANVEQLLAINTDLGASYELVADIDFSGVSAWLPIGYYSIDIAAMMNGSEEVPEALAFHGTFDGNGHTMKNLSIVTVNPMAAGVFGFTAGNAYLHDINIENFSTKGILCCGSLVGWASGKTLIENVTVKNANNRGMSMVGALTGSSNGDVTVKNVKVNGGSAVCGYSLLDGNIELLAGYGQAGGVIGGADGTSFDSCSVKNFKVVDKIAGNDGFGGLAGCANEAKYVKNCSVENVTIKAKAGAVGYIGGLVGHTGTEAGIKKASKATKITGCTVKNVKIIASDEAQCVGGLIGGGTYRSDEQSEPFAYQVSNCRVSNVTMKTGGSIIGSIAGYTGNNSSVKSCTAKNVTINGKTLSAKVGADPSVIPYTELTQFGGAL
ncbi:MAG: hypothetical protein IJ241_00680 [Clostridia bacterium]|nr:hypothetical protein [Clostridia bacterium]